MWHKAIWKGHPMRLELTRVGLLVELANHYTTTGAFTRVVGGAHNKYQLAHSNIAKLLTHPSKYEIFINPSVCSSVSSQDYSYSYCLYSIFFSACLYKFLWIGLGYVMLCNLCWSKVKMLEANICGVGSKLASVQNSLYGS